MPALQALRRFIESGEPLSNAGLENAVLRSGDPELTEVLQWSMAVNEMIARTVRAVDPFPGVHASLARLKGRAEIFCVSQTPVEALAREWREAGLRDSVSGIFGKEYGSKVEQLRKLLRVGSASARLLMIGDAPGDHAAVAAVGGSFYPILPGREAESWQRFQEEAIALFFKGRFEGAYAARLVREFDAILPEHPPW
ncbi:MAG: HAD family hydrolase [Kiritimatiellia bacterium]